ncbi:MAG: sigma-54-dependent Fis family transcriptional regulator [Pedobacter sp.]|nr:MAG: sigma-54-dependent Fis family transcriptional regulator [Pedobacter sp.]
MIDANILVIDDDDDILLSARLFLKQHFNQVLTCKSPREINVLLSKNEVDIILLDMNYQKGASDGREGLYWLEHILSIDKDYVVILMTAFGNVELAVQAIKKGATDFILKPWENEKLFATLSAATKLRQSNKKVKKLEKIHTSMQSDMARQFENIIGTDESVQFTDAREDKPGRFEMADGGTIFLDEIGNLSLPLQAKLLSVLQNRTVTRLGESKERKIDIRLISATNMPLNEMVAKSTFRQDLLFRINTVELILPPLRERGNDIVLLANHFLQTFCSKYHKTIKNINAKAQQVLLNYSWPGNVRELQHVLERAVIMTDGTEISESDLQLSPQKFGSQAVLQTDMPLDEMEKMMVNKAIEKHKGNISRAAAELGLTRAALYRRIEKFGL